MSSDKWGAGVAVFIFIMGSAFGVMFCTGAVENATFSVVFIAAAALMGYK